MRTKGFTLIELLAVIVILAVIALIATPAVLNIIEDSKRSAAEDSARIIAKAAETYYVSEKTLEGNEVGDIDLTTDTLKYKGEKPEKGYVTFDDKGNAYLKMYMNGYCVESNYDNTVESEKTEANDCKLSALIIPLNLNGGILDVTTLVVEDGSPLGELPTPTREDYIFAGWFTEGDVLVDENTLARENLTLNAKWTKGKLIVTLDDNRPYIDGEVVYFNPVTNSACSSTDYVASTNSTNGFRGTADNGCLMWRAFLDSNDTTTVRLLLDHSTSTSEITFAEAKTEIANVKDNNLYGWHADVYPTARLISVEEVNAIAPYNGPGTWTPASGETYSFHAGTTASYEGYAGTNKYAWLFDNLGFCENYGCNVQQYGYLNYWTSTPRPSGNYAYTVYFAGSFGIQDSASVRPVIEVPKDLLFPTKEVAYGETYGEIPEPTKEGYTFTGWRTTGGAEVTSDSIYQLTTDTTIYAQWSVNTYTVTFKNGDEVVSTKTVTYGQPYGTLPADQTKEGYVFKGWKKDDYTAITGETLVTTASNHNIETFFVEKTYLAELYFNPVTNEACTDYNATTNSINGYVGATGTGCMKWYAYKEDGDNYLMILDHNSLNQEINFSWAVTEITNVKNNNKYGWHAAVHPTARLISAEEINEIAPYVEGTWTTASGESYSFHTGTIWTYRSKIIGLNKYGWLFDNTSDCATYGCNVEQDGQASYWTSSAKDDEKAWEVTYNGSLVPDNNKFLRGVRPVISVPKSKFN